MNDKLRYCLPGMLSNTPILMRGKNPVVFLTIKVEGVCNSRIIFHLFATIVPNTAENFRKICIGTFCNKSGNVLTYKGAPIHRIIPGFMFQGGDIVNGIGTGSDSIYGKSFNDENFTLKHSREGVLSMSNVGPNTNGCQFFVTFAACPWLDDHHVVFGEVIEGLTFAKFLETFGSPSGKPTEKIYISDCGVIT